MAFYTLVLHTLTVLAFYVAHTFEEDAFLPDQGKFEFSFVAEAQKNYSLVHNLDVKAKLFKQYVTSNGCKIEIYNDVLTTAHLQMLQGLATYKLGSWSYRISEADVYGRQKHVSPNNMPWYNEFNTLEFSQSIIGKQLQKVVMEMTGEGKGVYVPYKVVAHVVRSGDSPKVHADAKSEENDVSMVIYLNENWRKNDYGDLYLYDDNKEIVAGVVPRYGRVVVWHSSIPYLTRPPSVAVKGGQIFLRLCFTKNQTKFTTAHERWLENQQLHETTRNKGFFLKPEEGKQDEQKTNVETKLVSEAKSKEGKKIFVFDGLFTKDLLDQLRSAILNHGVYFYDDSYDKESDNVQWIAAFEVDKYVQSRMWRITKDVATFVSGGHGDWFPYDVSCNLIRNADTTQIHHDCVDGEDEWTFLLYLNPDWSINDYGETVFYEKNDDITEIITEVLPKYGRVVIFQGIIPHSARPPSRNFTGARLSFAVKLSTNERTGRLKASREELKHLTGALTMLNFINQYIDGSEEREEESVPDGEDDELEPLLNNSRFQEIRKEVDRLTNEGDDVEKFRKLAKGIRAYHLEAREEIGDLIRRLL